jgi:small-conductance mechanosensitive channel
MIDWFEKNWISVAAPLAVFVAFFIIALWTRRMLFNLFPRLVRNSKWEGYALIRQSVKTPFLHWIMLLGAYIGVHISILPDDGKELADRIVGSLLTTSLFWVIIIISEKLLRLYLSKANVKPNTISLAINISRVVFIVSGVLIVLEIWGAPTTPLILILGTALLVAILASRNAILNIFAGIELTRGNLIKPGDYIKLGNGEEGYLVEVSWTTTRIKTLENNIIVMPNGKLTQNTIVNHGKPMKEAKEPFKFYTRLHLKELTGVKASNIAELIEGLKSVPEASIYYHTHHFIEEHHYLIPEPANDFSVWVGDALDNSVLSEKLAGIDTYEFTTIAALRARMISVIEEYVSMNQMPDMAATGREFYFIKSIGLVLPTNYLAYDLREFVEILRKISLDSLYFHMFESRLRLGKGINDFSAWIRDDLDEPDIANSISRLDPYNYTLTGLKSVVIQLIEKRIK